MLTDKSCESFTSILASSEPVPGGGGAAALCGALGSALCSMAASLTADKKKFAEYKSELNSIIARANEIRAKLLLLIDADAEGFAPLAAAYSLRKDAENYSEIMTEATLNACKAPFEMMHCAASAIELLETLNNGKCSRLLISDVGCGASLCRAALECAAMNVFVNTKTLRGNKDADSIELKASTLLREYSDRADAVSRQVLNSFFEVK